MCIPIELDVPVLSLDYQEVGTAREITCPCPGDKASEAVVNGYEMVSPGEDLWLRVERLGEPDLYIPFVEIAETRPDGVRLRLTAADVLRGDWACLPPGFAVPAGAA